MSTSFEITNELPKDAESIRYFEANNKIFGKILNKESIDADEREETNIFYTIFTSNIDNYKTVEENFQILSQDFSNGNGLKALFEYTEETKINWITLLRYNQHKKPEIGILIIRNNKHSYDLKSFFNSNLIEENDNINFENIIKYFTSMTYVVEKRLNEK